MWFFTCVDSFVNFQVPFQLESPPAVGTQEPVSVLPVIVRTQLVPGEVRFAKEGLVAEFAGKGLVALMVEFMHFVGVLLDESFFTVLAEEPEIIIVLSFMNCEALLHHILLSAYFARKRLLTGVGAFMDFTLVHC